MLAKEHAKSARQKGPKRPPLPAPSPDQIASEEALEKNEMTALLSKGSNMFDTSAGPPRKVVSDNTRSTLRNFESDPEVSNCLLSPAEVEIKETDLGRREQRLSKDPAS